MDEIDDKDDDFIKKYKKAVFGEWPMKSNVVVVCGSRSWTATEVIRKRLKELPRGTIIRNGRAPKGADFIAAKVARELGIKTISYWADWDTYGKRAGLIRNILMLDEKPIPYLVIAFWDGLSTGTKHTIDQAIKRGIDVDITTIAISKPNVENIEVDFSIGG